MGQSSTVTSLLRRGYERGRRSAWIVWLIGAGVYFFGMIHRASLGVAGPDAIDRLQISATELGSFVMVQLGVYAFMQVPAGLVIDRWGPRKVLIVATLTMGTAQVLFGFATSYPVAVGARGLLGMGDAAVFIAVLRLAAGWFPSHRYAVLTMATGLVGMAGNLLATVPLALALGTVGWTRTFVVTGAVSIVYALLLLRPAIAAPFRGPPPPASQTGPPGWRGVMANVRATLSLRETQLGFWTHQATMSAGTVVSLVWGYPFLTEGLGYTSASAASQLSLYVLGTLAASVVVGPLAGRRPGARMPLAIGISVAAVVAVLALVVWPGGVPPTGVVTAAFLVLAVGGPGSQIGFHIARDYNPVSRVATATGVVNSGGFSAAMVGAVVVGIVLDARSGGAPPTLLDYRWAMSSIAVISAISTVAMVATLLSVRRAVLRRMVRREDVIVPVYPRWWDQTYARMVRIDEAELATGDPQSQGRGAEPEAEHPDGVRHRDPSAPALGEADGVEAGGTERGVAAEQAGAEDGREVTGGEPADHQAQQKGPGDVDEGHPERHLAPDTSAHGAVDDEPQGRPDPAGERDDGDHDSPPTSPSR